MARDGSGDYARVEGPYINGQVADADEVNAELDDIATALSDSINKSGTKAFAANQPMGGFVHTGLGAGDAAGESVRYEQLGALALLCPSGHRLTGTTALAVTTADVTAIATLYSTPDKGASIALYNGSIWEVFTQAELSMALDSDSGHTGYHQSGKIFDVFYFDDAGTKRIGTGPAWTNDTTRASAISRLNGVWVNTSSMTVRFGSASGNTVTVAASRGTYLGTIYCTANGQTEDSLAKRMVWNCYNRRARAMRVLEATDSWAYSTATWRQMNNSAANQMAFVRGLNEDAAVAHVTASAISSASTVRYVRSGIGLDATNAIAAGCLTASCSVSDTIAGSPRAEWKGYPGLGYHFLSALEYSNGGDTQTWHGDLAVPTIIQAGIHGTVFA